MTTPFQLADSYKGEHWAWINPAVAYSTGYLEPRSKGSFIQVAGISRLVAKLAYQYVFEAEDLPYFLEFAKEHSFGQAQINEEGFKFIIEHCQGRLPVHLKALTEGSVIKTQIPVMQVRNTIPGMGWVVPYFELLWLHLWKTMDVATNSFTQKIVLAKAGKESMPEEVFEGWLPYALHDFGARSTGSNEEAEVGLGHLYNFLGSDNWIATEALSSTLTEGIASYSVLALEHNVVLSWGENKEHELFAKFAEHVLTSGRIGSMLIDTYDIDAAMDWVIANKDKLKQWAKEGDFKGRLVLRPDSGDPTDMPLSILKLLCDNFETTEYNGYSMLPSWIGVIQGDGNDLGRLKITTKAILDAKISLCNIVFGEGGELVNNYKRDDNRWAFKLSVNTLTDGTEVGCAKKPKHSPEKHSKEGYFSYNYVTGELSKADSWDEIEGYETVYKNTNNPDEFVGNVTELGSVRATADHYLNVFTSL
jgi:nicotinamide phosphoribosyltransferase